MRRFLLLLLASLALAGCSARRTGMTPPPVGHISPPAGKAQPASMPWLLHVHGTSGYGTAFATTYKGTLGVMTAWHVVRKGTNTGRVYHMGASLQMTFRQVGNADVAWAPAAQLPATWEILQIAPGTPVVGDIVEAWGYPGMDMMGTRGRVLSVDYPHDDGAMLPGKYMQIAAEVRPGMSGGPVIDSSRRVVGVIALSQTKRMIRIDPEAGSATVIEIFAHYPARIP